MLLHCDLQTSANSMSPKSHFVAKQTAAGKHQPVGIVVTQRHLLEAARNVRPSVSPAERFKYQQMYVSRCWLVFRCLVRLKYTV